MGRDPTCIIRVSVRPLARREISACRPALGIQDWSRPTVGRVGATLSGLESLPQAQDVQDKICSNSVLREPCLCNKFARGLNFRALPFKSQYFSTLVRVRGLNGTKSTKSLSESSRVRNAKGTHGSDRRNAAGRVRRPRLVMRARASPRGHIRQTVTRWVTGRSIWCEATVGTTRQPRGWPRKAVGTNRSSSC